MHRTTVIIPENLKKKAMAKAKLLDLSLGEFIRKSLELALENKQNIFRDDTFLNDHNVYSKNKEKDLSIHHEDYLY